jgi:hypothetical protein
MLSLAQGPLLVGVDGGAPTAASRRERIRVLRHATAVELGGSPAATGAAIRAWLKE